MSSSGDYRNIDALNQSRLKLILSDPRLYRDNDREEVRALFTGNVIDTMLLNEERFNEIYKVADIEEPTATLLDIATKAFNDNLTDEQIEEFVNQVGEDEKPLLWSNVKDTKKRKEKWDIDLFWKYLNFKRECKEKGFLPITKETFDMAKRTKVRFDGDEMVSKLLQGKEVIKHKVFQFKYEGFDCKCELDMLVIDHDKKTIQEVDIKSSSVNRHEFKWSFRKFRYDFQRQFYNIPVTAQALHDGYTRINPVIIYVPTFPEEKTLIFKVPKHMMDPRGWKAENGSIFWGVDKAIGDLKWHLENDLWEYPREYYENGYMTL